MPGFDGTGPRGMGPMTGGGRGFCSPWGIGASNRAGIAPSFPRIPYPFHRGSAPYTGSWGMPYGAAVAPGAVPFAPRVTREQELDFLRNEAEAVREQLEQIEARIQSLTSEDE